MVQKRKISGEIYNEILDIADLRILTQGPLSINRDLADHDLTLLKSRAMRRHLESKIGPRKHRINHVLELGIADGGGIPYLLDRCEADFIVGIDIAQEKPRTRKILEHSSFQGRFELYFETDQSDAKALTNIVDTHFPDGLDLIIDDASHLLDLSRKSFECLFPRLKPGGIYIIEDYSWGQIGNFGMVAGKAFQNQPAMIQLLFEISMLMPSQDRWITNISSDIYSITVQKGPAKIPDDFTLDKYITNWAGLDIDRLKELG